MFPPNDLSTEHPVTHHYLSYKDIQSNILLSVKYGLFYYVVVRSLALYIHYPGIFYLLDKKIGISFKMCIRDSCKGTDFFDICKSNGV